MSDPAKMVVDGARLGTKGFPRHYQAYGVEPPMKYEESGTAVPTVPAEPTKEELAAYARDLSWRARIAGTEINGVRVRCDDGAIALINGMAMLAQQDAGRTFNFDASEGIVSLTAEDAIALATAGGEFVQSTFDRRAAVLAAIADGSVASVDAIDAAFIDLVGVLP
ncbi:DUF4376 domain-containing protein [Martelella soudanensis]|uniref:DUF4376 domain-containing protein n=1 Tax=unclassified Martelella TaxID=2629616 RepID=UPI0015E04C7E|nr:MULTISPECIES: DUF4376 domain-containing protein [unclassified Martelella]